MGETLTIGEVARRARVNTSCIRYALFTDPALASPGGLGTVASAASG